MCTLSIQSPLAGQPLATTSAQGTSTVSSVQEMPAALLSRLSGSGADKPAFDPALIHRDSFLPHVAEELAQRPLNDSEGARDAAEALELIENLQGKPVTDRDFAQLEELRAKAWKSDGAAGKYCDTLARVLLLRPLMGKLEAIDPPEARAQLADVLHTQVDRLLSAGTPQQFWQIKSEMHATQELFRQQGMMGPEQEAAFRMLDDVRQYHHKVHTETFPALQKDAEKVLDHDESARPLNSVLQDAIALCDSLEPGSASSAPLLGQMGLQPLQAEARDLASRLYTLSEGEAGELARQIDTLLAQIRSSETAPVNADGQIDELRTILKEKGNVLTDYDRFKIQNKIDCLAGAAEVRRRVVRGENALQQKEMDAAQLKSLQAELKAGADDLALHPEDEKQLAGILGRLESKSKELQADALLGEDHFAASIEQELKTAASPEKYDQLAQQIDARLEKLPENGNLSPDDKAAAAARLKELAQQCLMKEFTIVLADTQSTRRGAPSVAECAHRMQEMAERRGVAPEKIGEQLAELSSRAAKDLEVKITALQTDMPAMSVQELRNLSLMDLAEAMERRVLPSDREVLGQKLATLISQAEDALFEKTAGPELDGNGVFEKLDETQKEVLRKLCIQGGCHPSLISALKDAAGGDGLKPLLEAADQIFKARQANKTPARENIEQLDAFLLPHPELDDAARNILGSKGKEPDYRFDSVRNSRDLGRYMDRHFPNDLKRKLGLQENTPVGRDMLKDLVWQAAEAHGRQGRVLKKVDLTLIQALWYAEKAQNSSLSFEAFKQDLPHPFKTMPMLKEHLASGIGGRRDLKRLGQTVEDVSLGLGSKKALVRFLTQAQSSDPKWAAGSALGGLYRSLGLNPHSDPGNVFQDAVQDTPNHTAEEKKQTAGTALGDVHRLHLSRLKLKAAGRTIMGDRVRNEMATRLGIDSEVQNPGINGATLATGILMAEKILNDPATNNGQKQALLDCIHFQRGCNLDGKKMEGFTTWWRHSGDTLGNDFRETLSTLRNLDLRTPKGQEEFDAARKKILEMCADAPSSPGGQNAKVPPELRKRAEAVLYFKRFQTDSTVEQIKYEFTNIEDGKKRTINKLGKTDRAFYESYKKSVSDAMRLVIGTGQRQGEVLTFSENNQENLHKNASEILEKAQNVYAKEEQKTLSETAALVVCEQFVQNGTVMSVADVKNQFGRHSTNLKGWPFYKNCLDQMTRMGIPEEHAELYLQGTLDGMKEDFFAGLAQKGLQGADTYTEIDRMVEAWMDDLEDPGNSLTFKKSYGASVEVPIVEAGAGKVSAHLEVARENGVSVWKGEDGQYHMTLMKGAKAGLGVGAEVALDSIISAVEAHAEVNIQGSVGCDLTFPNQTQCHMFLSGVLSGRAGAEHLGLCNAVSSVREAGMGASAELSLGTSVSIDEDVDIVSAGITGGAEISGLWTVTQNSGQKQYTRTVHGSVSVSAEASLGTEDMQDAAEAAGEALDDMAYIAEEGLDRGDISDALQTAKPQLSVETTLFHREFEEKRSVTTNAGNGALEGSERVRAFVLSSKKGAAALLRDAGASQQTIRDVLADMEKLSPGEEFRIELVSNMRQNAVQDYNAAMARGEKPHISGKDFDLREVRLVTEDALERTNTLNLRMLSLQSGRSLNRTHTEAYDARPVLEQAA